MVSNDRAQLVLVGAIAIGIVLIGMTTLLNSAVFTENVAGGNSAEVTGEATEFNREAVRNLRSLVIRVNHAEKYNDSSSDRMALNTTARGNVENYSRILGETYADTGSVYVNVSYGGTVSFGSRVLQQDDADFSRNDGQSSWTVVTDEAKIGWFVMNLNVEKMSQTNPVWLNFTDSDGTQLNVSLQQTPGRQLAVRSEVAGGNTSDVTCTPRNGRVLLDIIDGSSYTGDCTFNSTEYLDPPYTNLAITNGANGNGTYDLVVNDSAAVNGVESPPCSPGAQPCAAIAIWSVEFSTHYRTGSISYERTHNVSVYG